VRPELKIVAGRMFRPAVRELIAGAGAAKQFRGLTPGSVLHLRNADWTVTGVFTTNGDVHESELLADVDTVGSSLERSGYSSAVGLLTGAASSGRSRTRSPRIRSSKSTWSASPSTTPRSPSN
jgi:putative ABC transport system permease protein